MSKHANVKKHEDLKSKQVMRTSMTRKIAGVAILSAMASVLMYLEFPLPFLFPPFLQMDLSEIPVLIGAFAYGPLGGILVALIKNILHMPASSTAFAGELANFSASVFLAVPAGLIYRLKPSKKGAILGLAIGVCAMTAFMGIFNYVFMIDFYAGLFGITRDDIIAMSSMVNHRITDMKTLVLLAFVPFNLLKGTVTAVLTVLIYKPLSPLLKGRRIDA